VQNAEVVVLIDDSASMQRRDAYAGDARMRKALEKLEVADPAAATRSQIAQAVVDRYLLPQLAQGKYVPRVFTFSDEVAPLAPGAQLTGRGHATHIGAALSEALATHRGRHVTDLVIVSDGRQNGGTPLSEAARSAAASGVPVHTIVVGDTRPERNAVVELVEAPPTALEGDEIAVTVRVHGRGLERETRTEVRMEEYDPEVDDPHARRVVTTADAV
jgi:hypothetical protein